MPRPIRWLRTSPTTQTFTINLGDIDEFDTGTVIDNSIDINSIVENASIGTTVGITALASDADATTNTATYSLFDNDGGRFAIDANTGVVTVAGAINRETDGATRNITIRATSADASFTDQVFLIAIVDANEFDVSTIVDASVTPNFVFENSANGVLVGIVADAFDGDATLNGVVYSLDDSSNGRFVIDSTTGVIRVANGSAINYEATSSLGIIVRATSADGSSSTLAISILVGDVNEMPNGGSDVYSTSYIDTLVVSVPGVFANDSDPDSDSLSAILVSGPSVGTLVFNSDGSFTYTPHANFVGMTTFTYRVTDGSLSSGDIQVCITVLIPNNLPGSGGSGSGSGGAGSGDSGSGGNGSGTDDSTPPTPEATPSPIAGTVTASNDSALATEFVVQTVANVLPSLGPAQDREDPPPSTAIDVGVELLEYRADREHQHGYGEFRSASYRDDTGRRYRSNLDDRTQQRDMNTDRIEFEDSNATFGVSEGVVKTVLGTGLVIWMIQGAQLLATIIAATPAWIQLDPMSVLLKAAEDEIDSDDEIAEGERIFDQNSKPENSGKKYRQ